MVRKGSPRRISKDTEHFGKQNGGSTDSRWNQHKQRLRRGVYRTWGIQAGLRLPCRWKKRLLSSPWRRGYNDYAQGGQSPKMKWYWTWTYGHCCPGSWRPEKCPNNSVLICFCQTCWCNGWLYSLNSWESVCVLVTQSCPTLWPHWLQPSRVLCPWNSPGKNTGVGYHFLLHCMKVKSESKVAQSCPTLSDSMDCSLPGSSIHGIFQARILEWGAIAFSSWESTNC